MSDTTPRLQLPLIGDHSQKRIVMNAGLMRLESLVQAQALSRTLSAQPATPADGDSYILPATPTGAAWASLSAGTFVRAEGGIWETVVFPEGAIVFVKSEGVFLLRTASGWTAFEDAIKALANLSRLGVGTTADAYNVLAMKGPAALLSGRTVAEGGSGDISLTLNKEADGNSAQILLQKGYSGRAIIGLLGNNDLTLKVSGDGAAWRNALTINRFSGRARFAKGNFQTPHIPARNYVTGAAWLVSTSAADNGWRSLCWSAERGLFCAVSETGTGNRVMTSPDGITWTARTSAADNNWLSVCWSPELGLFCAIANSGTGNRVMTSPDGITWTARSSAADNAWRGICWSPELMLFCAVAATGTANRVMTSPDGITWTARASATDNNWISVCWAPELGLFCAVSDSGTGNRVMTSPDGIIWTARTSVADNNWHGVCWSPELGLLCAVSVTGTGNRAMTSPDGVAWTGRTSAADNTWQSVAWSSQLGLFCAVSDSGTGNRVMTSPDGVNWSTRSSAADNGWYGVCWSAELGLFAATANTGTGNRAMTSVSMFKFPYRS
ncbi:DUF2793 domain-containing protein [Asticcacaulis taihuensis]|uniref:DUF2793 domain-containing protein n=1 Tax=Asticcacaulis taihuensis TaxID=260084 RepID=A0A1G4TI63_9CAUL|nr:DUF2793 domain-containing protein [Asticcacaulis taihuensis]SCW80505.1 Protein of unknown function [Asticcacaulis taihuensis]